METSYVCQSYHLTLRTSLVFTSSISIFYSEYEALNWIFILIFLSSCRRKMRLVDRVLCKFRLSFSCVIRIIHYYYVSFLVLVSCWTHYNRWPQIRTTYYIFSPEFSTFSVFSKSSLSFRTTYYWRRFWKSSV